MKQLIAVIAKEIAADAPAEFELLPAGAIAIEGEAESAVLDEAAAASVIAAFERRGNDMVIDYEHQTIVGGQAPAAGWIKRLAYDAKRGLIASVEWTAKAVEYLKSREYRYFSPVMYIAKSSRRVVAIESVALTNQPRINHLKPIVAKLNHQPEREENAMFEKIKTILKLAADATEEKALEAVTQLVAKLAALESAAPVVACKEVLDALGATASAGKEEVVRMIASIKAPGDVAVQLSHQVAELTREIAALKQADLVTLALKNGQTSPDELEKWGKKLALEHPEQFRLIVLSRPAGSVVPVEGLKLAGDKDPGGLDEAQRLINKQMGIDEETYKKFGPKAA